MAHAAASVLAARDGTARPVAVVGRDRRAAGEMLEAAVVAGLTRAGADVYAPASCPTPRVAYLTARHGADLGVMISASHNPMPDNGIKLFSRGGHKLPDADEAAIERAIEVATAPATARPVARSAACTTSRAPPRTTSRTCSRPSSSR